MTQHLLLSDLCYLGSQISYNHHSPAALSTPLVFGWAKNETASTPGVQVSMTTPHLLNTNLDAVKKLEAETGNRYSLCAAGYVSISPLYALVFGLIDGDSLLPQEFAIELASFLSAELKIALDIHSPAAVCELSTEAKWADGYAAIEFSLSFSCTAEDWTKAEHLAQVQVQAGRAISDYWEKQDRADAVLAVAKETSELLSRFGTPPTKH